MRVYISGNTAGLTVNDKGTKFHEAEIYLKKLKHEPVNPLTINSNALAPFPERLGVLADCEAIFLLSGWSLDKEALIEKYYSHITGKEILFESRLEEDNQRSNEEMLLVSRIKGAVEEVTGLTFEQYTEDDRRPEGFFARMLFSVHCKKAGIDSKRIIHHIPRDRTTILHYLNKYPDEFRFNKEFRETAEKINLILYPEVYHCDTSSLAL